MAQAASGKLRSLDDILAACFGGSNTISPQPTPLAERGDSVQSFVDKLVHWKKTHVPRIKKAMALEPSPDDASTFDSLLTLAFIQHRSIHDDPTIQALVVNRALNLVEVNNDTLEFLGDAVRYGLSQFYLGVVFV